MKYLLCFILIVFALGTAGPPLYYTHALPLTPAIFSAVCLGFACYLFDPTNFLAYAAELRKNAKAWITNDSPPAP